MKSIHKTLSSALCEDKTESTDDQMITLNAYVNKKEESILYVECGEDFVDLLFSFLAIPLGALWKRLGKGINFGCIENLSRSFKDLSVDFRREAKCVLPYYYKFQKQLLDVVTIQKPLTYYRYANYCFSDLKMYSLSENSGKILNYEWDNLVPMIPLDLKSEDDISRESTTPSGVFVKRGRGIQFIVTDDLSITLLNVISSIELLKGEQIQFDNVDVQEIIMKKEEALRLLEASLVTSTALSTALLGMESVSTSRCHKKPKIET